MKIQLDGTTAENIVAALLWIMGALLVMHWLW